MPVANLRNKLHSILEKTELWDKKIGSLQVSELGESQMQLKILASASNSDKVTNLRALIREELIQYIVKNFPDSLPKTRTLNINEEVNGRSLRKKELLEH